MKTINYVIKENAATTQYRAIKPEDKKYILDSLSVVQGLLKLVDYDNQMSSIKVLFNQPSNTLPRMTRPTMKRNSLSTFIDGVLDNMKFGTQQDVSHKTCQGLTEVFKAIASLDIGIDELEFKQVLDLNTQSTALGTATTFSSLFNIEDYVVTVTFTKK